MAAEAIALATELFGAECVDPYHESAASLGEQRVAFGGAAFAVVAREGGVPFLDAQGELDSRAVFAAASHAQKAADYLSGLQKPQEVQAAA